MTVSKVMASWLRSARQRPRTGPSAPSAAFPRARSMALGAGRPPWRPHRGRRRAARVPRAAAHVEHPAAEHAAARQADERGLRPADVPRRRRAGHVDRVPVWWLRRHRDPLPRWSPGHRPVTQSAAGSRRRSKCVRTPAGFCPGQQTPVAAPRSAGGSHLPPDQARLPTDGEVLTVGIQQLERNRPTRTSRTTSAMPCLRRRNMTSPNGRSSPADGSTATTSPSTIARPGPAPPRGPRRHQGTDRGQQPGRDPGQQGSKTVDQRQPPPPAPGRVGLGDRLVLHRAPLRLPCFATRKVGLCAVAAPVILFNAHGGHPPPACHLESVREAECQLGMSAATVR